MTKQQPDESKTDSFFHPSVCPHCHEPIDRTYGDKVNFCGKCGAAISKEAFDDLMIKLYYAARDYQGVVLIINDDIRNAFNRLSEKMGHKKLQDPRDVIPILVKKYNLNISSSNTEASYLAQIVKELHDISMKLGDSVPTPDIEKIEPEKPAPKKRGRPKKNQN